MTTPPANAAEAQRVLEWITERTAPGQPCDACGFALTEDERYAVATLESRCGLLLFAFCELCRDTGIPKMKASTERFLARLVGKAEADFVLTALLDETRAKRKEVLQ